MSDNNNAGLTLFAELDDLFQDFSSAEESTIAGGSWSYPYKLRHLIRKYGGHSSSGRRSSSGKGHGKCGCRKKQKRC